MPSLPALDDLSKPLFGFPGRKAVLAVSGSSRALDHSYGTGPDRTTVIRELWMGVCS